VVFLASISNRSEMLSKEIGTQKATSKLCAMVEMAARLP
jgi:hypothetical protein